MQKFKEHTKMKKLIMISTITAATLGFAGSSDLDVMKAQLAALSSKVNAMESTKELHGTLVKSKVPVLKFSGKHYLGFKSTEDKLNGGTTNKFETRRNYIQIKGYFKDQPKSYMRVTLDTHKESGGDTNVRLKYAYLYLDNVLPNTGVEFGQAHRPWIDYEEHNGWNYRSVSKVMVEDGNAAHFTNSSDLGINFKTKMDYFSSELGVFNGEGYHGSQTGNDLSLEWRLTGHIMGNGKHHVKKKDTYANISYFGQQNKDKSAKGDFNWHGLHAVYNQPAFLVAAQYIKTTKDKSYDSGKKDGKGYSVNGEYRFMKDWNFIGRYDKYKFDNPTLTSNNEKETTRTLAGLAYKYNKNVEMIANILNEDKTKADGSKAADTQSIMLSTEVNW